MRQAVIISTARTSIGKSFRGAFNDTSVPELAGHTVREAVPRANIDAAEVEDVILESVLQEGTASMNTGRQHPDFSMKRACLSGRRRW